MTTPLRLHYAPDNASLCVRLALEELGVQYQTVLVNRARQEQKSGAYLALNPNGHIPVLETPDGVLFETGAILLWLADTYGGLVPKPRGLSLKWLFWLSNSLHVAERMLFYPDQFTDPDHAPALRSRTQTRIMDLLTLLQMSDADWLDTDTPSILGCYLGPLLRWPALYGGATDWYELQNWPRLAGLATRLDARGGTQTVARAEGLGAFPFSAPHLPTPLEGSAV